MSQNNYLRTNDIDTNPAPWTDQDIEDIMILLTPDPWESARILDISSVSDDQDFWD